MIENQTNSITKKDYDFYLSCSKEELGKLYRNNAIREKRLNKKIQDIEKEIKEIEKINILLTRVMITKNKDISKNLIPFRETSSYKSAMKYKENLSSNEKQTIIDEVAEEINRKYDEE